jgi:hypothetical protein
MASVTTVPTVPATVANTASPVAMKRPMAARPPQVKGGTGMGSPATMEKSAAVKESEGVPRLGFSCRSKT